MASMTIKIKLDTTAQVDAITDALEMSIELMSERRRGEGFGTPAAPHPSKYTQDWTRADELNYAAARQAYEAITGKAK